MTKIVKPSAPYRIARAALDLGAVEAAQAIEVSPTVLRAMERSKGAEARIHDQVETWYRAQGIHWSEHDGTVIVTMPAQT